MEDDKKDQKRLDRLAAYEDTDLEPEDIERILDSYGRGLTLRTDVSERVGLIREIPNKRLMEIAQAEKDRRLVVLPDKQDLLKFCPIRVCENGNCSSMGGFCQPNTEICKAMQAAYELGGFNARMERNWNET